MYLEYNSSMMVSLLGERQEMAVKSTGSGQRDRLRELAEEKLRQQGSAPWMDLEAMSPVEIRRLVHELHVHQIQLEMQNEELRQAHLDLDATRSKYFDLYDMAPISYVSLDEKGVVLEANLAASALLETPRTALLGQSLTQFIFPEDQDIYYLQTRAALKTPASVFVT